MARASHLWSLAWLALALAGCGGGPPVATANDAARANVTLAELEDGRRFMLAKCAGCHRAPMPIDHRPDEWPRSLDEMSGRAHLSATERRLIELYLVTLATR